VSKVTIEYDDAAMLGQMFQDAIVQCHLSKIREISSESQDVDGKRGGADLHQSMLVYYDEKVKAYEKMRDSLGWN
jgi:hypothetical protein